MQTYRRRVLFGSYDFKELRACQAALRVTNVEKNRNDLVNSKGPPVPGTFEWITTDKSYQNWQQSKVDGLWITAGPGRGKTMLSLFILTDLEKCLSHSTNPSSSNLPMGHHENIDLYYFFCSGEDGSRRSAIAVLRSLILQIVTQHEDLMKYVLDSLQPMAPESEQYLESNRSIYTNKQLNNENEQQPTNRGKNDQQFISRESENPEPTTIQVQSNRVKNIFRSGAALIGGQENDASKSKEADRGSNPAKLKSVLEMSGKREQWVVEPEKPQDPTSETPSDGPARPPEVESPKSRQLQLLGVSGLSLILRKLIRELDVDKAYFLLDGVDECTKKDQEDLISTLFNLWDGSNIKSGKFKLLVVSRPISGMEAIPTIKLEQITSDIGKIVSYQADRLANVDGFNEEIRQEVEQTLLEGAQGTLLWASLVLREIKRCKTCSDILATIQSIPPGLSGKYARMLQQIDERHRDNVHQILGWVAAAVRPLTLQELSVVINAPSSPIISPVRAVRDEITCSEGILEVRGDEVTFVHTSAKDFLLSDQIPRDNEALEKLPIRLEQMNYYLAQSCYDYIRNSILTHSGKKVSELSDEEDP